MNKNNIFIEAAYEFKCSRRNILFGIFAILAITGLVVYQFTPLSERSIGSIEDLFHSPVTWVSQALPSSIPYKTAYYFNLIQLLFVVGSIANDSRVVKLKAKEVLYARPLGNSEIAIGNFLGKLLLFTLMNFTVFAISILVNVTFYPRSFDLSLYLFYWVSLNFPASVYFLGLSYLVIRLIRQQGLSILLLLISLGTIVYYGAGWLNGLFDPCARYIPNMFSDFTGHVNLENYLLQRGFILLTGIGLLALSVIPYPRIRNYRQAFKKSLNIAVGMFTLACGLAIAFTSRHETITDHREAYKRVYEEHGKLPAARIVRNDLHVKEKKNGNIAVNSRIEIENRNAKAIPLVIYLNPGLKVNSLEIDGKMVPFKREQQAIVSEKKLKPGEKVEVTIDYEGNIENDICFLDTDSEKYHSSTINNIGIYRFGYTPAFCGKEYKLLTPECIWYPVCVPPYGETGIRDVNFSRYSLRVEHDPRLTAISQGSTIKEKKGETTFTFDHDMPGISLCIGNYKKREITVDSTRMTLYYLPRHEYLIEKHDDFPVEDLREKLKGIKEVTFESECIRTAESKKRSYLGQKNNYDPTQKYPYRWFSLVEVPCNFHCFPGITRLTGERVQGGIVFIPEKKYSLEIRSLEPTKEMTERDIAIFWLNLDIEFIKQNSSYDVKPMFSGKTMFISSRKYPIIHDILTNVARGDFKDNNSSPTDDYLATEYLNGKSLKDALLDKELSSGRLGSIIRKKSEELWAYIMLQMKEEQFQEFYLDFAKNNLFQEITSGKFFRRFNDTFGFRLDSLVENCYNANRLPLLDVRDVRIMKITETDTPYSLYSFKVFNWSDVPGLIKTGEHKGWIIPPHEGREIRARGQQYYGNILQTPLAQNIPAIVRFKTKDMGNANVDTTTGVFKLDASMFPVDKNENEIIVDNEDPGFKVVKPESFITSLFRKEKKREKYHEFFTEDTWLPTIQNHFYGFPVKSAYFKSVGSGKQKVEWNVTLSQKGKYEVFFYYTEFNDSDSFTMDVPENLKILRSYTVFDGEKKQEVIVSLSKKEEGSWISLGTFDFSKNARVTLSDKTLNKDYRQGLVADAVKWVKVME
ncbi:hypothetical protein [Gabonibacter massiliensis]|uniref:golvesin C-terminal-like domain-containing protein n=1 Tax=Gabonibacter massiliensis TaxID=1720195 RepID=UPI00073F1D9B|nr:hypothetical protein [Gabonibacter massiliensis]